MGNLRILPMAMSNPGHEAEERGVRVVLDHLFLFLDQLLHLSFGQSQLYLILASRTTTALDLWG